MKVPFEKSNDHMIINVVRIVKGENRLSLNELKLNVRSLEVKVVPEIDH